MADEANDPSTEPLPSPVTLTRTELDEAVRIVRSHVPATPQYDWPLLTQHARSHVTVKHENHTPIGAFKVRGGLVYFERLVP